MTNVMDDLFGAPENYKTYGIKYAGSKQKLIPYILQETFKLTPTSFLDCFSGTTRVSQSVSQNGVRCISNDISLWSEVFAKAYLLQRNDNFVLEIIQHLNLVTPKRGWFTENYCGDVGEEKKVWQVKNGMKLDAIRSEIDTLNLDDIHKSIALTSLIMALDKVDSTLGHFTSYLKQWSARSFNDLRLEVPPYLGNGLAHAVTRCDVLSDDFINLDADVAYMDPPYGSNNEKMPPSRVRYASYYHLWTTVIKNDKPAIFGAAGRREDSRDAVAVTPFEEFRKSDKDRYIAIEAIEQALKNVNAEYVLLSYSSGGRATAEDLTQILESLGTILNVTSVDYKKHIMASMSWTKDWLNEAKEQHKEFIFTLKK